LCRLWLDQGIRPVVVLLQSGPNDLAPDFDALPLKRVTVEVGSSGYGRYGRLAWQLFWLSRRHGARALLSMPFGWHAFIAAGARLGGVKRVVAHVGNFPDVSRGVAFRRFRLLVQLGRLVTSRSACCSRYVQQGVCSNFGLKRSEVEVIYNGIPVLDVSKRAAVSRAKGALAAPFTIGMVARLEVHKDQPTLIRAAALLRSSGLQFRLWLVGGGSRRPELASLISESAVADRVQLLGMRRDIPELLGRMDLFVFSTTPDEGLGIALIEAMAAGVPVVASDVGACREVLDGGELGILVRPKDPEALALAIQNVMTDPASAAMRAARARAKVEREFTIERMAAAYADLLGISITERRAR
jgi:glycosyltransferase involved in cell wall biosynthesis